MDFDELLACAKRVLHERKISRMATAGTVAAAILTDKGNVYTGVCIETPLEWASARNMPLSRPWSPQGSGRRRQRLRAVRPVPGIYRRSA